MDKTLDEVLLILGLVYQILAQASLTGENLNKLNELTRSLTDLSMDDFAPDRTQEPTEDNSEAIDALEAKRMGIVMAIQKQEFFRDKLQDIVSQNQDIIETVKEYFQLREQITAEEEEYARCRLDYYRMATIDPAINHMERINSHLNEEMSKVERLVNETEQLFTSQMKQMDDPFNFQVNNLIVEMNKIFRLLNRPTEALPKTPPKKNNQRKRDLLILPLDRPLSIYSVPSPTISLDSIKPPNLLYDSLVEPGELPDQILLNRLLPGIQLEQPMESNFHPGAQFELSGGLLPILHHSQVLPISSDNLGISQGEDIDTVLPRPGDILVEFVDDDDDDL